MKHTVGLAAVLLAGMSGVAAAQVIAQAQQPVVVAPAPAPPPVIVSPSPAAQPGTVTTTTQPVIVSRVYAPQGVIIQTNVDQPAPFNPAPIGTVVETTAGPRTVREIRGYDVVYDEGGKTVVSHAMLTDGLGNDGTFSNTAVENFWPLQVGKSETFNYNTSEGGRAITLKVLRTEIVTVPAGQFYTYVIERRDRRPFDGTENVATMWYAPSVGSVVKFQEEVGRANKPRPPYEATAIRLPQALTGTTVVHAVRRPDTVEMQNQYCRERGTTLRLADGRTLVLDCSSYVQADRLAYENWLLVR